ncbi:hypothetical protein Tco_0657855 [Tanacetum coccineum]
MIIGYKIKYNLKLHSRIKPVKLVRLYTKWIAITSLNYDTATPPLGSLGFAGPPVGPVSLCPNKAVNLLYRPPAGLAAAAAELSPTSYLGPRAIPNLFRGGRLTSENGKVAAKDSALIESWQLDSSPYER